MPAILREAVQSRVLTRSDRAHFNEYADSSLVFEVVYHVLSPDFDAYMDVQQEINLAVFRRFAREGIRFVKSAALFPPV